MSDRIPVCAPVFSGKERAYLLEAIDTGWISSAGPFIARFETALAGVCKVRHAEACANGTVALHLLLHALGVGPGHEVIVPSETFVATANAVRYTGATPVFCEVDERSWVIDPADALGRVTAKTRAIIGVDLFGVLADYDALRAGLATLKRDDVVLLEDAAEAIGSTSRGRPAGSLAHAGVFSFFGNKTVTTGEGGAITTDDVALGARMKFLKNHGMDPKRRYHHPEMGFNYRMTNLQAAVGCAQLEEIEALCARKRHGHARYRAHFADVAEIRFAEVPADQSAVPWLNAFVDEGLASEQARDAALARLSERGIEARPFFEPNHLFPYFGGKLGDLPRSERIAVRGVCLPSGAGLTDAEIDRAADAWLAVRKEVR
ncbi:MAG: DegT/DnrJ/EryC1/StrS family aminotransferase [Myxococcales bacterium]|nr:DegT/DnrJ/EryC1/StrS family aminotransferase [Myxococcales bacterium]